MKEYIEPSQLSHPIIRPIKLQIVRHLATEKGAETKKTTQSMEKIVKIINIYYFRPLSIFRIVYYATKAK